MDERAGMRVTECFSYVIWSGALWRIGIMIRGERGKKGKRREGATHDAHSALHVVNKTNFAIK